MGLCGTDPRLNIFGNIAFRGFKLQLFLALSAGTASCFDSPPLERVGIPSESKRTEVYLTSPARELAGTTVPGPQG